MDDIQLLVYILLIGFGIFSRFLKAKKKNAKPSSPSQGDTAPQKPKVTFDELLKEFTGESREPEEELILEPVPAKSKPATFDYDDDEIQQRYQESLRSAESLESENDSSEVKDDRHTGNFTHFRGYDQFEKEDVESEYLTFLREEDGPRKAIILAEILNRRY